MVSPSCAASTRTEAYSQEQQQYEQQQYEHQRQWYTKEEMDAWWADQQAQWTSNNGGDEANPPGDGRIKSMVSLPVGLRDSMEEGSPEPGWTEIINPSDPWHLEGGKKELATNVNFEEGATMINPDGDTDMTISQQLDTMGVWENRPTENMSEIAEKKRPAWADVQDDYKSQARASTA